MQDYVIDTVRIVLGYFSDHIGPVELHISEPGNGFH